MQARASVCVFLVIARLAQSASRLPLAFGLACRGPGRRATTSSATPGDGFAAEFDALRSLRDELRAAGAPSPSDSPEVHIRHTASVAGVLRYAARRGQPVLPAAEALVASFDADPDRLRRRARRCGAEVAHALSSRATRSWRAEQLAAPVDTDAADADDADEAAATFVPKRVDDALLGRLYYSAIAAAEPALSRVGLSSDVLGLCVLLALSRAAAAGRRGRRQLDAAVTNHFHAVRAPDGRARLVRGFWRPPAAAGRPPASFLSSSCPGAVSGAAPPLLVIAFSSLGNGVIRHEWRRALHAAAAAHAWPPCDVLFVADPGAVWYCADARARWDGGAHVERRVRGAASRGGYGAVVLLGDSMGGSAALRFAGAAAEASGGAATLALAFVPQVDLGSDPHVTRDDFDAAKRARFEARLVASVVVAAAANRERERARARARLDGGASNDAHTVDSRRDDGGGFDDNGGFEDDAPTIVIHRGTAARDAAHAARVGAARVTTTLDAPAWRAAQRDNRSTAGGESTHDGASSVPSSLATTPVVVVEHADCDDHLLTTWLKQRGELEDLLGREVAAHCRRAAAA